MKLQSLLILTSVTVLPLSLGACGDDKDTHGDHGDGDSGGEGGVGNEGDGDESIRSVALTFRPQVGDELFACGETYKDQGSSNIEVTPQDFRFYVSDLRLIDEEGEEVPVELDNRSPWQSKTVALLDFEDASSACKNGNSAMNATVTGKVPDRNYVGVVFSPAVPLDLNHEDPATLPDPLQAGGMTWGWLFGYKFLRAELAATAAPEQDEVPGVGVFHLGSTGCDNVSPDGEGGAGGVGSAVPNLGAPPTIECAQQNRAVIRLEEGFSVNDDVIVADIGAMMKTTDLSDSSQCHSGGLFCEGFFESVGLDFATGDQLNKQTAFRVEGK